MLWLLYEQDKLQKACSPSCLWHAALQDRLLLITVREPCHRPEAEAAFMQLCSGEEMHTKVPSKLCSLITASQTPGMLEMLCFHFQSPASEGKLESGQNPQERNHHHTERLTHSKNEGFKRNHFFPSGSVNSSNSCTCREEEKQKYYCVMAMRAVLLHYRNKGRDLTGGNAGLCGRMLCR